MKIASIICTTAAEGATIAKAEKIEVRAEAKEGKFAKLEKAKILYGVKLTTKDGKAAKIKVAEDGTVAEALKTVEPKKRPAETRPAVTPTAETKPAATPTAETKPVEKKADK